MARLTGNGILFDLLNPDDKIESFYWMYPAGTRKVFWQATAPTGWTQDTSMGGDKGLRVVNGTGGGTGGVTNFSTVLSGSNSLSVPINDTYTISGSIGNHTLSVSQLPDHTHTSNVGPAGGANATPFSNTGARTVDGDVATGGMVPAGGGGSHDHPFSGSVTVNQTPILNLDLAVTYVDVIICSLN